MTAVRASPAARTVESTPGTSPWLSERHRHFFDLAHVRANSASADGLDDDALITALLDPANTMPADPNPFFDCRYVAQTSKCAGNPIVYYLERGERQGAWPNPFLSPGHFRRRAGKIPAGATLVERALHLSERGVPDLHPMLDPGHVAAALGLVVDRTFFADLLAGRIPAVSPHHLVDLAFVEAQYGLRFESLRDFFVAYHRSGEDLSTHVLFDCALYRERVRVDDPAFRSVYHYLASPNPPEPHRLVDRAFYNAQLLRRGLPPAGRALDHYLTEGRDLQLSTSPAFSPAYYAARSGDARASLVDYLEGGFRVHAPHGLVDVDAFARAFPQDWRAEDAPATLLAAGGERTPADAMPAFDLAYFRHQTGGTPSLSEARDSYLRAYLPRGTPPNGLVSTAYVQAALGWAVPKEAALCAYLDAGLHHRPRLLLAIDRLEETVLTLSWLNVFENLARDGDIEPIVLARSDGPLLPAFRRVSHVRQLSGDVPDQSDRKALSNRVAHMLGLLADNPPALAICAVGADSTFLEVVRGLVPACLAMPEPGAGMAREADEIAPFVATDAFRLALKPARPDPEETGASRHRIRKALGLPDDALLVLGAGPFTFDSGLDFFANLAARVLTGPAASLRPNFIWSGSGPTHPNTPYFYATHRLRVVGGLDRFHIVPDRRFRECLAACDVFVHGGSRPGADARLVLALEAGRPILSQRDDPVVGLLDDAGGIAAFDPFDLGEAADRLAEMLASGASRAARAERIARIVRDTASDRRALDRVRRILAAHGAHLPEAPPTRLGGPGRRPRCILVGPGMDDWLAPLSPEPADIVLLAGPAREGEVARPRCEVHHVSGGAAELAPAIGQAARALRAERLVVLGTADLLTGDMLDPWASRTWHLRGRPSEIAAIRRHGVLFDRIETAMPSAIEAMRTLDPAIAARMRPYAGRCA